MLDSEVAVVNETKCLASGSVHSRWENGSGQIIPQYSGRWLDDEEK